MSTGGLIVQLGIAAYILFTLLPDSSTQMVAFPWVLLWQVGLLCFAIAALLKLWRWDQPFYLLGNGLDWAIGAGVLTLGLSTIFSQFPDQSMWYSLTAFGYAIALYVTNNLLHGWFHRKDSGVLSVLRFQGILGLLVIIESLGLWAMQSWLPQLNKFAKLQAWGLSLSYDFSDIESRNGFPMGHQNYVAGFLMLVLPLLMGLAIMAAERRSRFIWLGAIGLGLVDLYTTSSRGGFLGLGAMVIYGIILALWHYRHQRILVIGGSIGAIAGLGILINANNRLRSLIVGLINSFGSNPALGGGELFFRAIAADVGWRIGLEHWLFGAGAGSVVMLYQQYRPDWAGREAEILFQLHSTPVHLWAELGLGGVITILCLLVAIASFWIKLHRSQTWQNQPQHQVITYALFASLLGYGVLAITDYQLDVPAIAGGLVVILAMLAYLGQIHTGDWVALGNQKQPRFWLAMLATVYLFGAIAWLVPVNRAWQASSVGFLYLARAKAQLTEVTSGQSLQNSSEVKDLVNKFQDRLKIAHQFAPWEPYYPYQLGWNLADLALSMGNQKEPQVQAWQQEGLNWIKTAIAVNPHNEAMYNAAAWLSYQQGLFADAETYFRQGLQLHPLKRSLSFGLGLSLLRQNKVDQAIAAMVNEVIHDPIFITSPIWNNPSLQPLYPQIVTQVESAYSTALNQAPSNPSALLKLASLHWWIGKPDAVNELERSGGSAKLLADAIKNDRQALSSVLQNPQTALELVIAAWLTPEQRPQLLERAYVFATAQPLLENDGMAIAIMKAMGDRMGQVPNFDQWLRSPVPDNSPLVMNYRRARVGFGVVSRHIDGVIPVDFFNVSDRAEISLFLRDLFPVL